jgi:ribosomal protein S18 acetylase RimI-like enzyme
MTEKAKEVRIEKLPKLDQETLERLIEIYMNAYEGMREYGGEGESYAKRYLRWCWEKAKDGFFVAKVGDEMAGFIVCDRDWYSKYEARIVGAVHEFAVDKKFQGHGIGHKLMETCLDYLGRYTDRIELWVGEKNEGAMRFYEDYGFKRVGQSGIWVRMIKDVRKDDKGGERK